MGALLGPFMNRLFMIYLSETLAFGGRLQHR